MEGYKLADGNMRRLTRPQIQFLNEFLKFKINLKAGKTARPVAAKGKGAKGGGVSPEELAAQMLPRFEKMREDGRKAEIAAAEAVMKSWEEKNDPTKRRLPGLTPRHRPKR